VYTYPMSKLEKEAQMVHMRVEVALLKRLEDFRFKYRFNSRSEAARWLLTWAVTQDPQPPGSLY
jgi:hypothetical protein